MKRFLQYSFAGLIALSLISAPAFHTVHAANLVFCNTGTPDANGQFANPCTWSSLILLIKVVIRFLIIDIGLPATAIVFAYAGFMILSAGGNTGQRKKGKDMFQKVVVGFAIALAAWAIVNTILVALVCKGTAGQSCDYSLLQ